MTYVHIIYVQSSTAESPLKFIQVAVTFRFAGTLHLYRLACDWQCNACCLWASVQALLRLLWSKDFASGLYKMCICAFSKILLAGLIANVHRFVLHKFEAGTPFWSEPATDIFEGLLLQLHLQVQAFKSVCGRLALDSVIFYGATKQQFSIDDFEGLLLQLQL